MNKNELLTLEQVHDRYDITIWDGCAFMRHYTVNEHKEVEDELEFVPFLTDKLRQGYNCFIPIFVEEEYLCCDNNCLLEVRKKLIKEFETQNKILPDCLYPSFVEEFLEEFNKVYEISAVDLKILSYGVMGSKFTPTSIISNDKDMCKIWKMFINHNICKIEDLGFFARRESKRYSVFDLI